MDGVTESGPEMNGWMKSAGREKRKKMKGLEMEKMGREKEDQKWTIEEKVNEK